MKMVDEAKSKKPFWFRAFFIKPAAEPRTGFGGMSKLIT